MANALDPYIPGPPANGLQTVLFYLHIGLATLLIGVFGLPLALLGGRRGAIRVATVWNHALLRAARWHFGLRYEIRGTPPTGPAVVAAKHQSFLDILVLSIACCERAFIMKKQILNIPVMGWYAKKVGSVPIDRAAGLSARQAMINGVREARDTGELGQIIIYPEGTRTAPGTHRPYKKGVNDLVETAQLPCYPAATNAGMFWPKSGWGIRSGIAVIEFFDPLPASDARHMAAKLQEIIEPASDALMARAGLHASDRSPLPSGQNAE